MGRKSTAVYDIVKQRLNDHLTDVVEKVLFINKVRLQH